MADAFVKLLCAQFGEAIRPSAFYVSSYSNRIWIRRWGWKADLIETSTVQTGVVVNLYVYLPQTRGNVFASDFDWLSVRGLGLLRGSKQSAIPYPPERKFTTEAARLSNDLKQSLIWFDDFNTPRSCLNYLSVNAPDPSSIVCGVGSPAYKGFEAYLESLPLELENICCWLRPFKHNLSEEFSDLFGVPPAASGS